MRRPRINRDFVFGSWSEGKNIDRWSIVHFLGGILLGTLLYTLTVSPLSGFLIVAGIAVAWEILELLVNIPESLSNRISDVVIALVGYTLVTQLESLQAINIYSLSLLALYVILLFLGWLAWKKRTTQRTT